MTQRPDTLVLDVDGTLVDSTYHHAVAWHRAFHAHDVPVALWEVHRAIGLGGDRLPAHVAGEDVEERLGDALRERWEAEYEYLLPEVRPFAGAADVVRALHARGWRVAVASSGPRDKTEASLEAVGIADLVTGIASAKDVATSKPAPDVVRVAVEEAGGSSGVLVGDSPWDGRSAAEAGYRWVGVRTGGFSAAELEEEAGAALVVDAIGDLREHLEDDLLVPAGADGQPKSSSRNDFFRRG